MIRAPTPHDYSEEATQWAVCSNSIQHPVTLTSAAIGVVGGLGLILLTTMTTAAAVVIVGGVTVSGLSWAYNFFGRRDQLAIKHHRELHELSKRSVQEKLKTLEGLLRQVNCVKGSEQIPDLIKKFDTLRIILERNLDSGELTFSRYLGIAEQIFRSAIDNLHRIANLLLSIKDMEIDELNQRIAAFQKQKGKTETDDQELNTLLKRQELHRTTTEEVQDLLLENEEALTALDQASVAAARMDTNSEGGSSIGMEPAMNELARLLERTQKRSAPPTLQLLS